MTNFEQTLTNAGRPQVEIGLLCFQGHQATTVHGLTDLFSYANHFARDHGLDGCVERLA